MCNKDAGFQSATSLKIKLLCQYFSKPFSKFLEWVLNRTPFRGCCGIKILKFLFLNALSFVNKPLKSRKWLHEILDIYVFYRIFSNKRPLSFKRPSPINAHYNPKNIL